MPQTTRDLIEQYVSAIKKIYGGHIKQIILYADQYRGANNRAYDQARKRL